MHILFTIAMSLLPPCAAEDSTNCHWDAQTRGIPGGYDFISLGPWTILGEWHGCAPPATEIEPGVCRWGGNAI